MKIMISRVNMYQKYRSHRGKVGCLELSDLAKDHLKKPKKQKRGPSKKTLKP